jgi:hypothetical protein
MNLPSSIKDQYDFRFISERDTIELALMMKMHYHIISNSSFSWWGAYLSEEDEYTLAPYPWLAINPTKDIYDPSWHLLEV